jgi:polysaccharide deacetylase 2 family uncharacterized protein YibQ
MRLLRPNRRPSRLNGTARRGLELVFWIIFALAVGVGGPAALTGLPQLGDLVMPSGVLEAQASGEAKVQIVSLPLAVHRIAVQTESARPMSRLPAIAIVIDDMGGDLVQNRRAIGLPRTVSLSFLPDPADTPMLAREARRAGHEILAHVPMQAANHDASSVMALRTDVPPEENIRRLDWALMRARGYAGINNHEGSVFTTDRQALAGVAQALYGRGVYFLDSRTTPNSQVVPVARAFGVPSAARDVFLDDEETPEAIAAQLRLLEQTARANGVAIAIGHPHALTLEVLSRWCRYQPGFRLVPASLAIRLKTEREMGVKMARSE